MVKNGLGFYTRKNEIRRRGRKFTLGACVQICILEAPFTIFTVGGAYAVGKQPLAPVVARLAGYSPSAARGMGYLRPLNAFGYQFPYLNTTG